jgi:hypothetical protein
MRIIIIDATNVELLIYIRLSGTIVATNVALYEYPPVQPGVADLSADLKP